jgi:hypothetical protein
MGWDGKGWEAGEICTTKSIICTFHQILG